MLLRAKLMMIVGVAVATMMLGFWLYYKNTQKRLQEAAAENARQAIQIQEQKAIQEQMEKDIKKGNELRQEVNKAMQQTQRSIDDMRAKFTPRTDPATGQTVTLGQKAVEKTDTVERAVNRGTFDQLRCFELVTGSPLTEEERNGTKTNSLCPEMLAPAKPARPAKSGDTKSPDAK
jgi:type II secretory pathway pseudopilin PulG